MQPEPRLAIAVTALAESFRQTVTEALLLGYQMGLSGVPIEAAERACVIALQRCRFMPVPAELREIALTNGTSYASVAAHAFVTLQRAVVYVGEDRSVNFADGAINATVRRLGGWRRVCLLEPSEFDKWFKRDFTETYTRVIREGCREDELAYLPGLLELKNADLAGKPLPGGGTYDPERHGGGRIATVPARYRIIHASPEPTPRIAAAERLQIGVKLKTLEA
jgi:hypothetical protein